MRLHRVPLALLGLVTLAASACGGSGGAPEAAPVETTSTTTAGGVVIPVAPLTGVPDETGVTARRPALAVKIDNAPKARPQAGLDVADLVFEEVVEGGVTRFIAVFHSAAPDEAGPVRSVRPMDPNLVGGIGGLFAYSGGIPKYMAQLRQAPVQDVGFDVETAAYRWAKDRPRPHNLFARPEALWSRADEDHAAPPAPVFEYRRAGEAFGGEPAAGVRIPYSRYAAPTYAWEAGPGAWLRSQDGAPHVAASGARIAPENLVVQFVATRTLGDRDPSGTSVTESIVVGEGDAWFYSGGRVVKGRWSKADRDVPTRYTDAAGAPVRLAPGRTWIHLAPQGAAVSSG